MRSIITFVFFAMTSTHKQILTKAHYYLNIFTVYVDVDIFWNHTLGFW